MKALRLPTPHPGRFWFATGFRAVLPRFVLAEALPGGGRSRPSLGRLVRRRPGSGWRPRGRGGISQVPWRSIPCLCPAPRPRPNQWSLTKAVPPMLPPRPTRRRLQRSPDLEAATGLQHPLPTLRTRRCRRPRKARFRLAGWPLPGEGRTLRIATKGFRAFSRHPPFQGLPCRKQRITLDATPAGQPVVAALDYLRGVDDWTRARMKDAPTAFLGAAWKRHALDSAGRVADNRAYVFAALEAFRAGLKRRDVFVPAGVRYADPRQGLLSGEAWNAARLTVCRSLDRSPDAEADIGDLTARLDRAWRQVAVNLPNNPAARIERRNGRDELVLSPLDRIERPPSLIALQSAIAARIPKIDLPDVMLEAAARSGFADAFTHVSERHARVEEFTTSLCGGLIAQACTIGFEPMVRTDQPALSRNRLSWVSQNFIRPETIAAANARIVAAQNALPIAHVWGNGEVASADGIRFVAPGNAIHAGANPKYFGAGRGITYYNLVSDQFTGLNAIVVPGTLRDSLLILGLLLDQETDLEPAEVMTDTAAYADTVFGLFWLLGYQFSP